jgi:hypothetical protein
MFGLGECGERAKYGFLFFEEGQAGETIKRRNKMNGGN